MHAFTPLNARSEIHDGAAPKLLKIILAYENLSAALWAAEAFKRLLHQNPENLETQLSPWSFSTLSDPNYIVQATDAAAEADLIVIAASSSFRLLPTFVEVWLKKGLQVRRSAHTAVAALFGCASRPDRPDSIRLQTVQRLAREAGCEFFTPTIAGPTA